MKKFILTILFILMAVNARAANVTFAWDANSETDLAGYRLYQSEISGSGYVQVDTDITLDRLSDPTSPMFTLGDVADGTHFWVLTAFDTSGNESGFSNEVTATLDTTAPKAPNGFRRIIDAIIGWFKNKFSGFKTIG